MDGTLQKVSVLSGLNVDIVGATYHTSPFHAKEKHDLGLCINIELQAVCEVLVKTAFNLGRCSEQAASALFHLASKCCPMNS